MSAMGTYERDLIVLTADSHQRAAVVSLLEHRTESLDVAPLAHDVYAHPESDPGVYAKAADFLRAFAKTYARAIVVLDASWQGAPPPSDMHSKLERELAASGWRARHAVIVIEPELETWIWADKSPHVARILETDWTRIHRVAADLDCWPSGAPKPSRPKLLFTDLLRRAAIPQSARIYHDLARQMSLKRCSDPSFVEFRSTLQRWFGR